MTTQTDAVLLESLWGEELRCDSGSHRHTHPCSVSVVYEMVATCGLTPSHLWCETRMNQFLSMDANDYCAGCKQRTYECWSIRPI